MTGYRDQKYLVSLVRELCALPWETEWVEFKVNDAEPRDIGEYISALANAAALVGKAFAYLVSGVRDEDHAIVGTSFDPHASKVGNEELEKLMGNCWVIAAMIGQVASMAHRGEASTICCACWAGFH